jgi:hypothetical protein
MSNVVLQAFHRFVRRLWASPGLLLAAWLVAMFSVPACTFERNAANEDSFAGARDVPDYACGDTLEGSVVPASDVAAATRVARVDYLLDSRAHTITLALRDPEDLSLGRIVMLFDYDFSEQIAFTTAVRYERSGIEVAGQSTRLQVVDGKVVTRTRHDLGDQHGLLWAELRWPDDVTSPRAFQLESMTLGVPATEKDTGPTLPSGDGLYRAQTVLTEGGSFDADGAKEFVAATGLQVISSNEDFQRMVMVAEDAAWRDDATLALRRCAATGIDETETLLMQTLGTMSLGNTQQAQSCAVQDNPFANVLKVESILGAISTGTTLTGLLVVAGVVSGGGAILGALVVTSVASYVILGRFEKGVQEQAKKAPGVRDLVNLGNDEGSSGGTSNGKGAGSRGDPHLLTFDGLDYDYQGAGEFILFEAISDPSLTVQVRQEPRSGICSDVAVNTAVATQIGSVRVHLDANPARDLLIDDKLASLPGSTLLFSNGDSLRKDGDVVTLRWASGERVSVTGVGASRALSIDATLPSTRLGQVHGLLGTYDGDRGNDMRLRNGSELGPPVNWEQLMNFGESFRIEASESLFAYAADQSTGTFAIQGFPSGPVDLNDLPEEVRGAAEQTCRNAGVENDLALGNCILDVGCTGDPDFANDHVGVEPDQTLPVLSPIDFSNWIAEGDGDWVVHEDGRSVVQQRNGGPTFFLSPQEYLNVRITGTLEAADADDDIIGFVFGYQKPLTAAGDAPNDLVTQMLSWKSRNQTNFGVTAFEGFTLSSATGPIEPWDEILWGHQEQANYEVLATDYGDGRGWDRNVSYRFTLDYTESMIAISIDDVPIFSYSASQAGTPFRAGRFGFYNYSQASVTYAEFFAAAL